METPPKGDAAAISPDMPTDVYYAISLTAYSESKTIPKNNYNLTCI